MARSCGRMKSQSTIPILLKILENMPEHYFLKEMEISCQISWVKLFFSRPFLLVYWNDSYGSDICLGGYVEEDRATLTWTGLVYVWTGPAAETSLYKTLGCWDHGIEGKLVTRRWRRGEAVLLRQLCSLTLHTASRSVLSSLDVAKSNEHTEAEGFASSFCLFLSLSLRLS